MKIETIKWERSRIPLLYPALQRGVLVKARLGGSIRSFLCEQLGLDPDYVRNRIQTAFLNGKPVDDFDSAVTGEGAVLTLSGALPGLAGATLRKGGFYSSLRASVSYANEAEKAEEKEGFISVRIFNILLAELAPVLLFRGIFIPRKEFFSLLPELEAKERSDSLSRGAEAGAQTQPEAQVNRERVEADFIELRSEK